MTVAELNGLERAAATDAFTACLAAPAWVTRMVAARPFASRDDVLGAAESAARDLPAAEWERAIAHHPRIGEPPAAAATAARADAWSIGEQAAVRDAGDATVAALASANAAYERRFGHTFIMCATGKSAADVLAALTARLGHDAAAERRVTTGELRQITLLRVAKLVDDA